MELELDMLECVRVCFKASFQCRSVKGFGYVQMACVRDVMLLCWLWWPLQVISGMTSLRRKTRSRAIKHDAVPPVVGGDSMRILYDLDLPSTFYVFLRCHVWKC